MPELSGRQWCARFPGSNKTADLTPSFRTKVEAFLAALKDAGATVVVSATLRPPERAYLMHWCCMVADSGQDPARVPKMSGVDIQWDHPSVAESRQAAAAMKAGYDIAYPAALKSRHTQGRAIDMTIGWTGTLSIEDKSGAVVKIATAPRSGLNPALHAVGATYGVIKLVKDKPHWSDDGA